VLFPLLAGFILPAIPAELDPFLLYCTGDERTTYCHPAFAFTARAPALCVHVIIGAKPAGKSAYSNFRVSYFHRHLFESVAFIFIVVRKIEYIETTDE
jgi:hypothetical protein